MLNSKGKVGAQQKHGGNLQKCKERTCKQVDER